MYRKASELAPLAPAVHSYLSPTLLLLGRGVEAPAVALREPHEVYGARGEVDRAFEWLDHAHTQRNPGLINAETSPRFRSLHGDPRWGAFLKKMGIEG